MKTKYYLFLSLWFIFMARELQAQPLFPSMYGKSGVSCCADTTVNNGFSFFWYFTQDTFIVSDKIQSEIMVRVNYLAQTSPQSLISMFNQGGDYLYKRDSMFYSSCLQPSTNGMKKYHIMKYGYVFQGDTLIQKTCYLRKSDNNILICKEFHEISPDYRYDEILFSFDCMGKWMGKLSLGDAFDGNIRLLGSFFIGDTQDTVFLYLFDRSAMDCFEPHHIFVSPKYGIVGYETVFCRNLLPSFIEVRTFCETWFPPYYGLPKEIAIMRSKTK